MAGSPTSRAKRQLPSPFLLRLNPPFGFFLRFHVPNFDLGFASRLLCRWHFYIFFLSLGRVDQKSIFTLFALGFFAKFNPPLGFFFVSCP